MLKKQILSLFLVLFSLCCFSQEKKITLQPIIFSSPETGLSFGGIAFYKKKNKESMYYNTALALATYSINDQLNILFQPDFFF